MPEDAFLNIVLAKCFPTPLQEHYSQQMQMHPLKREIIATKLSNIIVNEMGFAFVYRVQDETGAPVPSIVQAYMIARSILDLETIWKEIGELTTKISAEKQVEISTLYLRLMRRVTRWFLRTPGISIDISRSVAHFLPGIQEFKKVLPAAFGQAHQTNYQESFERYVNMGISEVLAHELSITRALFSAMDIIEISYQTKIEICKVAQVYFGIDEALDLIWLRLQILAQPAENQWESLSREALRDDLDWQQKQLTAGLITLGSTKTKDFMQCYTIWSAKNEVLIERWNQLLVDLKGASVLNYTMFFVAIRELLILTQATIQSIRNNEVLA